VAHSYAARLKIHDIVLTGHTRTGVAVRLRPMTEADWGILLKWNNDPEVLYYAEGEYVTSRPLEEVQELYCAVCAHAFCFMIEVEGQPVGECWLQEMNLDRILNQYPSEDCRRMDLMIGEKDHWGRGIGTETIRLLTEFGFEHEDVDRVFACDVADYNVRSRKAFQRVGYEIVAMIKQEPGNKARYCYDLALTREAFEQERAKSQRLVDKVLLV
jgi:RimJ/RimL family protein N-acetyltransferase